MMSNEVCETKKKPNYFGKGTLETYKRRRRTHCHGNGFGVPVRMLLRGNKREKDDIQYMRYIDIYTHTYTYTLNYTCKTRIHLLARASTEHSERSRDPRTTNS